MWTDTHAQHCAAGSVIYFIGAVVIGQVLSVVMRVGDADENLSQVLFSMAAASSLSIIPLADSLPPERVGPRFLQVMAFLAALLQGYT